MQFTIAMVRSGEKYPIEYVDRLQRGIRKHWPASLSRVPLRFVLITDQPETVPNVLNVYYEGYLPESMQRKHNPETAKLFSGWWPKVFLFNRQVMGRGPILYFDLDTVIIDSLGPLIKACERANHFLICKNFTKLAGHPTWPCNYGSCLMYLPDFWGSFVWNGFIRGDVAKRMAQCPKGDQQWIERCCPNAWYFQDWLPDGYLVGRRDFTDERPEGAAVMIFAGNHKPHNTPHQWLLEAWRA